MEIARFYFIFYLYSVDGSILQSRVLLCKNSWVPQYESGVSRPIKIEHGHQGDVPTNNQRVPPLFVTNYIFISSYTPYLHWQLLQFRWQKQSLLLITTTSLERVSLDFFPFICKKYCIKTSLSKYPDHDRAGMSRLISVHLKLQVKNGVRLQVTSSSVWHGRYLTISKVTSTPAWPMGLSLKW